MGWKIGYLESKLAERQEDVPFSMVALKVMIRQEQQQELQLAGQLTQGVEKTLVKNSLPCPPIQSEQVQRESKVSPL